MPVYGGGYYVQGTITLGIWIMQSGAWSKRTQAVVPVYAAQSSGGLKTITWTGDVTVDLGNYVERVGITVDSSSGVNATVNQFNYLDWAVRASSGNRSATPNGERSTFTIRPQ